LLAWVSNIAIGHLAVDVLIARFLFANYNRASGRERAFTARAKMHPLEEMAAAPAFSREWFYMSHKAVICTILEERAISRRVAALGGRRDRTQHRALARRSRLAVSGDTAHEFRAHLPAVFFAGASALRSRLQSREKRPGWRCANFGSSIFFCKSSMSKHASAAPCRRFVVVSGTSLSMIAQRTRSAVGQSCCTHYAKGFAWCGSGDFDSIEIRMEGRRFAAGNSIPAIPVECAVPQICECDDGPECAKRPTK